MRHHATCTVATAIETVDQPFGDHLAAAWSKRSTEGRDYLSVKLDDPSFTAPIYANLFDDEDRATARRSRAEERYVERNPCSKAAEHDDD